MEASTLNRHDVSVIREFKKTPPIIVDIQKVLQLLVNLISQAKSAYDESDRADKRLTVAVTSGDARVLLVAGKGAANRTDLA